ncbi:MAG: HAMP domain-containing histidine kinase [Clostridia bacterium]|nr:HAMP domain-containing histidine kinase [Clostridia bacterium]
MKKAAKSTKWANRKILSAHGEEIKRKRTLRFWFSSIVWVLFAITGVTTAAIFFVLYGILSLQEIRFNVFLLIAAMTLSSVLIGAILAAFAPKFTFKRLTRISEGMREIARGNFKTRVPEADKADALSEFGELERSFNQMASELDGLEIFKNDFINNFSHEFKTPIVSLRGFARQLQSGNLTDEQRKEYLDIIVTESERLAKMSSNVLLLTKLEHQQIVSEQTTFDLDEQIRSCILLLEKEWTEKEIELDIDLAPIKYTFNEEMLSHVFINLFSNAVKFTPHEGIISCRLYEQDAKIIFEIRDSGIGMTAETRERIFEKFYQGDTSHSGLGTGIGLNIVQRILALAGGDVTVESEPQKGSKFTVSLPQR